MNISFIKPLALAGSFAFVAVFQALPAAAQEIYPPEIESSQHSGKTRAEVQAEYLQALKEGSIPSNSEFDDSTYANAMSAPSTLTRAEVQAEAVEWMRLHGGDLDMGSR